MIARDAALDDLRFSLKRRKAIPSIGAAYRFDIAKNIEAVVDRFDVLEFLVEHYLRAGDYARRRAEEVATQVRSVVHGVRLSLGTAEAPDPAYVDQVAIVLDRLGARHYSEHLAFTRASGFEIDELLPIPFNNESLDVVIRNIEFVKSRISVPLLIENVPKAALYEDTDMSEAEFLFRLNRETGVGILFDVENAYADEMNWKISARTFMSEMAPQAVKAIHVAGGEWRGTGYVDDHAHDIPGPVLDLLVEAVQLYQPSDVIVERDDNYSDVSVLVSEVARVRDRLAIDSIGVARADIA